MAKSKKPVSMDSMLLARADGVKADVLALLEAEGGPLPAREIAARTRRPLRDVVNALCDGVLFRRVSRGVYSVADEDSAEASNG